MPTGGSIQINGRQGVPTPDGGAADAGNRERLTRAPLADGDRFVAAVRFRRSLTREDVPVSCRDCLMRIAENRQINKALRLGPRAA